jgi:hypothetical protein
MNGNILQSIVVNDAALTDVSHVIPSSGGIMGNIEAFPSLFCESLFRVSITHQPHPSTSLDVPSTCSGRPSSRLLELLLALIPQGPPQCRVRSSAMPSINRLRSLPQCASKPCGVTRLLLATVRTRLPAAYSIS